MNSIWNLLRKPTSAEIESAASIKLMKKNYPSVRVVGRGTVMVDSKEIIKSSNYQDDLIRAKKLVSR